MHKKHPWQQGSWPNMGSIRGRQDPGGPHVGPMNLAIWNMEERLYEIMVQHIFQCIIYTFAKSIKMCMYIININVDKKSIDERINQSF